MKETACIIKIGNGFVEHNYPKAESYMMSKDAIKKMEFTLEEAKGFIETHKVGRIYTITLAPLKKEGE